VCRRGDGTRDDFARRQQILGPRVDQTGAELREVQNARHQRDQPGEIERNDAAGEAGEAERKEELPRGAASQAAAASPAPGRVHGDAVEREGRRDALRIQTWIRLRSIEQWPKLPVVFDGALGRRLALSYPRQATASVNNQPSARGDQVSLKR